uniref:SRCR domain-containing protein n=1 Tax=Amphimedon queenslandica TaxID=400682 RepID=A0A1X7TKP1_AMPQE
MEDHTDPTYGELIDLLCDAEVASNYEEQSVADILIQKFISINAVGSIVETYPPVPLLPFEFNCYGNRDTLWNCYKSTIQCSNGPYRYATVTCQAKFDDWEVRLYGSSYENIGAVEVCIDGEWSSVCYDDFDFSDAATVCTQLGYIPYGNNESVDATCTDGSVRLVGGINELEGNVEICLNKFWGSVCHSGWNTIDANIACKQLGYQSSVKIIKITRHLRCMASPL